MVKKKTFAWILLIWIVFPISVNTIHEFVHNHQHAECDSEHGTVNLSDECPICDQVFAQYYHPEDIPEKETINTLTGKFFFNTIEPLLSSIFSSFTQRGPPVASSV
ncbi:MAG TPA: hypothetical protein VJ939_07295, partial [Bacteroidales bacterium]|nr:hypothetical protein [Bacteroidales bacterium]